MTTNPDWAEIGRRLAALELELRMQGELGAKPLTAITESGFQDVELNLADTDLAGSGRKLSTHGYGVQFLRRSSTPGGLLQLSNGIGLDKGVFAPGDSFGGYFETGIITIKLATGSANVGTALLRVWTNPRAWYRESPVEVPVTPQALLGTFTGGVVGYATLQTEDIVPTGAQAGQFNATGWKRAAVFVDTQQAGGGANSTSFQLNPFFRPLLDTIWFDQGGTQLISIPDSNPTAGRYRMFILDLAKMQGWVYLAIRNLLPGANTQLAFCVVGIE
jgi:hypothetical protein